MAIKIISERTLATISAGRSQTIRVREVVFDKVGRRLDIRKFFVDEHGVDTPTQRGISLKVESFGELRRALDAFERETTGS